MALQPHNFIEERDVTEFCTAGDVESRLRRELTDAESEYIGETIAEAQALVVGYLGCGPTPYASTAAVPEAVTIVTSRMVARVLQQDDGRTIGASQFQQTAGPFAQNTSFVSAAATGAPWLAKADKEMLKPYRCGGGMKVVTFKSDRRVIEESSSS